MVGSAVPSVTGVDADAVGEWLREHDPTALPPFRFELIAGGHSNLTYRVSDANGQSYALRRPPLGHVLATAHDMGREHKIVSALGPTKVPVAPLVGLCTDDSVNGSPFYVMRFVDGLVIRNREVAVSMPVAVRSTVSDTLIDTLADIHEVDVDAIGLGDLGRKDGYIARQLKRWRTQFHDSKTRELPEIDEVHERLVTRIPDQQGSGIVHGDYRLDNCIFGDDGSVRAVLDWELCTLGDVLADLAQLLVYWGEPGDDAYALDSPPSAEPGFYTRAELIARYAARSDRDLSRLDYYMAFASWKVACILEGVYSRYLHGAMGDRAEGQDLDTFKKRVDHLASRAASIARTLQAAVALFELHSRPPVDDPVLVTYFDGFIDAGAAASVAAQTILGEQRDDSLASFDSEALLDYRARRPVMHLVDGINTRLSWPSIELFLRHDRTGRELLLLIGPEPDHLWPSFGRSVCDLAMEFDVRLMVNLGAYPAATPHTRPPHLTATATSAELSHQMGFLRTTIDVPSGIHAVIEHECAAHGIPAIGIWAQVPHYASSMTYPAASIALLDGVRVLTGHEFDVSDLSQQAANVQMHLAELVARNDEHVQMVRQLEMQDDMLRQGRTSELPSGDDIAAEVEQFLREQDD